MREKTPKDTPIHAIGSAPDDNVDESLKLPDEIWLHILSMINPEFLIKMIELVSSRFRDLVNEEWIWKKMFILFFPEEIPSPLPLEFNWKNEFKSFYSEQFGSLNSKTRKLIFLITFGAIDEIRALNITAEDLKADNFLLIKAATRFKRQTILDHFYSLSQNDIPNLLYWAVLCNMREVVHSTLMHNAHLDEIEWRNISVLAAQTGHLNLLLELLNRPENPVILNSRMMLNLYTNIVRSGQMTVLEGFDNFIEQHQQGAATNQRSVQIAEAAQDLPHPIILAATYNVIPLFKKLFNHLHQQLIPQRTFVEALSGAAKNGCIGIITYALERQATPIDLRLSNDGKSTLLSIAVISNQYELVQYLLANQADPELPLAELLEYHCFSLLAEDDKKRCNEMISILLNALKNQKKRLSSIELLTAVINRDRVDILEQLFALDEEIITKILLFNLMPCEVAILTDKSLCANFLLSKGAPISASGFRTIVFRNSIEWVQRILERSGEDAIKLVNAISENEFPIIYELSADNADIDEIINLLLPYVDMEKAIHNMIKNKCDITAIKCVIDFNEQVLRHSPINRENILAFAREAKHVELINTLELEIESENELTSKTVSQTESSNRNSVLEEQQSQPAGNVRFFPTPHIAGSQSTSLISPQTEAKDEDAKEKEHENSSFTYLQ